MRIAPSCAFLCIQSMFPSVLKLYPQSSIPLPFIISYFIVQMTMTGKYLLLLISSHFYGPIVFTLISLPYAIHLCLCLSETGPTVIKLFYLFHIQFIQLENTPLFTHCFQSRRVCKINFYALPSSAKVANLPFHQELPRTGHQSEYIDRQIFSPFDGEVFLHNI